MRRDEVLAAPANVAEDVELGLGEAAGLCQRGHDLPGLGDEAAQLGGGQPQPRRQQLILAPPRHSGDTAHRANILTWSLVILRLILFCNLGLGLD